MAKPIKDGTILDSINLVGKGDVEKYLENAASRVAATDYIHFKHSLEPLGIQRAKNIHSRIFSTGIEEVLAEAKKDLSMAAVTDLEDLTRIIKHVYANELKVIDVNTHGPDNVELGVKTCPFEHYLKKSFGEPDASHYFQSLSCAEQQRLSEIGKSSGLDNVKIQLKGCMCKGESECTIVIATN